MKKIEYSILQYYPSIVSGERINLGVIIYSPDNNIIRFEHISNKQYNRLHAFDDELNIDTVKTALSLIEDDINDINTESEMPFGDQKETFDLNEYTKYFTNEFHFTAAASYVYKDFEKAAEEIKNMYLRLYMPKSKRPSKKSEQDFIENLIKSNNIEYLRNQKNVDAYNLKVSYDFLLSNVSTGIKYFHISKKNLDKMINDFKAWAWNCKNTNLSNIVIVYSLEDGISENDYNLSNILRVLKSSTKYVVNIDDMFSLLPQLKK